MDKNINKITNILLMFNNSTRIPNDLFIFKLGLQVKVNALLINTDNIEENTFSLKFCYLD